MESTPLLQVRELCKSFGGLHAVSNVSFSLKKGVIKGVIGPNGAGKTTLFNCISGFLQSSGGTIHFDGRPIQSLPPHAVARRGIARTFQTIKIFSHMSVLDNVMVGCHCRSRGGVLAGMLNLPFTWKEEKRSRDRAMELLELFGIAQLADHDASQLAFGQQRAVEFARALALEPRLLLLDEPASGLNMHETVLIGERIRQIRDRGVTVLIVEHDMSLIMSISDEILVISFGTPIAEGTPGEIQRNPEVIKVYLGENDAAGA